VKIISKEEAIKQGLKKYFTGVPCKNGHIAERFCYEDRCDMCKKKKDSRWRKNNLEKVKECKKDYYKNNVEKIKEKSKEYRKNNSEKIKEYFKEYHKHNIDNHRVRGAKRRASKKNATPFWSNITHIKQIYADAIRLEKSTGIKYHTDHIVPLQGKTVCGLHVPDNLRNITYLENCSKHNLLDEQLLATLYPNYWIN
jgi:hypothetical protein